MYIRHKKLNRICACCGDITVFDQRLQICPNCNNYFIDVVIKSKRELDAEKELIPVMNKEKLKHIFENETKKI